MEIKMKAREYVLSFTATILNGLCADPKSRECEDSLIKLQGEIDKMPFIKQFGNQEFSFLREPEDYAVYVLGESEKRVDVPIEIGEAVARMMAVLLVDNWGKTLLNL